MRGSNKNAATQVGFSQSAIVDALASLREICQRQLLANPIVLEIDESCFSHKPKHHRGRNLYGFLELWIPAINRQ